MKKQDKRKFLALTAGILCILGIFWFVLVQAEKKYYKKTSKNILQEKNIKKDVYSEEIVVEKETLTFYKKKYDYFDEIESYLLIGTDASGVSKANGGQYHGNMADFILLAIFNKTESTYSFLQLDRDTITEIDLLQEDGSANASADIQLCTAHWYGGSESEGCVNTVNAVSAMLGNLTIDGYYELNMKEIPVLNHAIGGVTVTLEDDFSNIDKTMQKGKTIKLKDNQAFHYVHDRYQVGDERNISRMRRQRNYMKEFFKIAVEKTKEEPAFGNRLYKRLKEAANTDINGRKVSAIMNWISAWQGKGIYVFEGKSKIGKILGDGEEHAEFYIDKKSKIDVMTKLYGLKERKS